MRRILLAVLASLFLFSGVAFADKVQILETEKEYQAKVDLLKKTLAVRDDTIVLFQALTAQCVQLDKEATELKTKLDELREAETKKD